MNKLNNINIFLSGPIDRVEDDGVGWRKKIKKEINKIGFDVNFFDPTDKPEGLGSEIGTEKIKLKKLISQGKWDEAKKFVKKFRRYDLRGVDWCDLFIIYIDINVHMCGSYDEYNTAERQNKPIFVIMGEGQNKSQIPGWLIASMEKSEIFNNISECVNYIKKINNGQIEMDNRWVIINK
ncbi:hypothetical protein K9M42_02980 [Patescibacteria group bacterium]|nr:hypothetical protein [Patescibacteria group bacterium]